MFEIKNVSKSYNKGGAKAVDSLSLTVNNGEIFGFLGPNGAGKSTFPSIEQVARDVSRSLPEECLICGHLSTKSRNHYYFGPLSVNKVKKDVYSSILSIKMRIFAL